MVALITLVGHPGHDVAQWSGLVGQLLVIVSAVAIFEGVWIWLNRQARDGHRVPPTSGSATGTNRLTGPAYDLRRATLPRTRLTSVATESAPSGQRQAG